MSESGTSIDFESTRLSRITTLWTQFQIAHEAGDEAVDTRNSLLLRYRGAIRRYLTAAVKDASAADELFHEFSIRFLQGDFHRANQKKGRFRDYVRAVLINLVNDYHRDAKKRIAGDVNPNAIAATPTLDESCPESEVDFTKCLRDELMDRTWRELKNTNDSYHAVLQLRATEPELTSRQIAERLEQQGRTMTSSTVRKTIERARVKFAELFFDEAIETIEFDSTQELIVELKKLHILSYCKTELQRRGLEMS